MSFKVSAKYKKNKIHLNFGKGVVSTGGTITILGKNNKELESINIGSNKISGGIYSLKTFVHDYPYNWIALDNDEIFGTLAKHDKKKLEEKTSEDWAFDLRTFWNVSMDGKFYRLDESTTYETSSDEWYNYHSTTPEYTPGYDESGRKDVVLTPLGGIKKLVVKPNKTTKKFSDSLKIDISDAGLMSASGDLTDYLNFEKPISLSKEGNSSGNNKGKKATIPKGHDHIFGELVGDLKVLRRSEKALGRDFEKNNDKITGRYDGRFITRDKNNKKISKTWRTAFHLDFKDMDIHSTTKLLARNTIRQIYYYPGTYNTLFGQGYYDGKSKGKLTYNYYDGRFADDKVLLKLKVKEDKYNRLEHTKFTSKDPRFMGNFTITLSKSEISFEDWEGGKNHMTAKIINDLL